MTLDKAAIVTLIMPNKTAAKLGMLTSMGDAFVKAAERAVKK